MSDDNGFDVGPLSHGEKGSETHSFRRLNHYRDEFLWAGRKIRAFAEVKGTIIAVAKLAAAMLTIVALWTFLNGGVAP